MVQKTRAVHAAFAGPRPLRVHRSRKPESHPAIQLLGSHFRTLYSISFPITINLRIILWCAVRVAWEMNVRSMYDDGLMIEYIDKCDM